MTSYAKRLEARKHQEAVKEHERELKEEKEAERQVRDR
jgi:rRNA-processing protein CGR1